MITQESSSDMISNDFMSLMKNERVKPGTWNTIENHIKYAKWLGEMLGYENMDDWYKITKTLICDNYGGGLLVSKYNNSTKLFVMSVFPDVEWLPWKFDQTLRGYWNDIENHITYAKWLGGTLGYKNMDDWYQITGTLIQDNYGGGLLANKYRDSPQMFLQGVFPDVEWLPWKFGMTQNGYWDNIENHIKYAKWLGETLGYKNMDDWYQITHTLICENCGGGLVVNKYRDSPLMFLKGVFPDVEWLPWKFGVTTNGYWDDIENHIKYANWLGERLGYKNMDDWYQINQTLIHDNCGGLLNKYSGSPLRFLEGVFPDAEWLPWKFYMSSHGTWDDIENHIKYANWLGETLGYKNMDDWYQITGTLISDNCGGGLLASKYSGSPLMFLKGVFPDVEWLPWKFGVTQNGYWNTIENHIKYANWLGETLGYKNMDDWYQINQRLIHDNCGCGLLNKYRSSPKLFVMSVYPEHTWDSSKFVKNYSQGQIEWLNYMILSIPDIIHAINNDNGEYLIPNSRYHADGYSESKKMILEYHGDFWHGNPKVFKKEEMNSVTRTTYGEQYEKTLEKQRFCEEHEYKYISIWESEWIRGKNSIIKLQQIFKEKYC